VTAHKTIDGVMQREQLLPNERPNHWMVLACGRQSRDAPALKVNFRNSEMAVINKILNVEEFLKCTGQSTGQVRMKLRISYFDLLKYLLTLSEDKGGPIHCELVRA
jgi:hypothetical protein